MDDRRTHIDMHCLWPHVRVLVAAIHPDIVGTMAFPSRSRVPVMIHQPMHIPGASNGNPAPITLADLASALGVPEDGVLQHLSQYISPSAWQTRGGSSSPVCPSPNSPGADASGGFLEMGE